MSIQKTETTDPVDLMIGKRIRFRRNLLGLTQEALARQLGVSFQQIQKYESGQNKISASRLYHIASALQVSVKDFYEDEKKTGSSAKAGMSDQAQEGFSHSSLLDSPETTALLRAYYEIKDKKKRKTLIDMMKGLQ